MRLLLTRAAEDATRTREKLEALGHQVISSPVLEIVGTGASWPPGVIDAVLATSGHAFSVPIDATPPEVRRIVPLLLVGARTASVAHAHDFLGPATIAGNAVALTIEIGKLASCPKRIAYLAGRDRKPDIETALDVIGHKPHVIEVYEARAIEAPSQEAVRALRHGNIDAILHFSRRSAALFLEMASANSLDVQRPSHLCMSEDVAAPLREAGLTEIEIAQEPNEKALLALCSTFELSEP